MFGQPRDVSDLPRCLLAASRALFLTAAGLAHCFATARSARRNRRALKACLSRARPRFPCGMTNKPSGLDLHCAFGRALAQVV